MRKIIWMESREIFLKTLIYMLSVVKQLRRVLSPRLVGSMGRLEAMVHVVLG